MNEINLLPEQYIKSKKYSKKSLIFLIVITLFTFLLTQVHFIILYKAESLEKELMSLPSNQEQLDNLLEHKQSLEEKIYEYSHKISVAEDLKAQGKKIAEPLSVIVLKTPEEIVFENIRFENDTAFIIKGISSSNSQIALMAEELGNSGHLKNVELEYIDALDNGNYTFGIRGEFHGS